MTPEELQNFKENTLKIAGLQESSKDFKKRKRAMEAHAQKKRNKHAEAQRRHDAQE